MLIDLILVLFFIASFIFRIFYVSGYDFAFTIDQARDMLEIRKLVVGHELVFIGPITSLNGVFLGPFWYYFNLLPFIVGGGNPSSLVIWQTVVFHLTALVFFLYFARKNYPLAFLGSLFLLLSPRFFVATSYAFNANTTPLFVLLALLLLDRVLTVKKVLSIFILGLLVGLTLQMEAAFGVLLLPLSLFWLLVARLKKLRYFFLGLLMTLAPQLLFELKHNFMMSRTFLTEFSGQSDVLGQRLDLVARLTDRYQHYLGPLAGSLPLSLPITITLFVICLIVGLSYRNRFFLINLSLLIFSFLFYLIYPNRLKDWWTINLTIPYLMIFASSLSRLWSKKNRFLKVGLVLFLIFILLHSGRLYLNLGKVRLRERSTDPALLLNQIEAIDWVYGRARGEGFKVYNFVPAVYDLNYQYLFWWYGGWKYGYQPSAVTYQAGVPEYIENAVRYWSKTKPAGDLVFLIRESNQNFLDKEGAWRKNYESLCVVEQERLLGNIIVEKLSPCKK